MITKLVLFLCLFCPVPDKERAILEDALSRCSSLERIGEIMDIVRGIIWNTGYRYIPLYTGSTVSVPPTDGGATRLPDSAGSIQEWILRRNLHRPCMPQLMERSYTQEEREDMDTV